MKFDPVCCFVTMLRPVLRLSFPIGTGSACELPVPNILNLQVNVTTLTEVQPGSGSNKNFAHQVVAVQFEDLLYASADVT